ncbi:hypothetical protein [Methanopyrus kandleri]
MVEWREVPVLPKNTFFKKLNAAIAWIDPFDEFANPDVKELLAGVSDELDPNPLLHWSNVLSTEHPPEEWRIPYELAEYMVCFNKAGAAVLRYFADALRNVFERPSLDRLVRPLAIEMALSDGDELPGLVRSELGIEKGYRGLGKGLPDALRPSRWLLVSVASHACSNRKARPEEIVEEFEEHLGFELEGPEVINRLRENVEEAVEDLVTWASREGEDPKSYVEVFREAATATLRRSIRLVRRPEEIAKSCLKVDPTVSIGGVKIGPEDYDPLWERVRQVNVEEVTAEIVDELLDELTRR